MTEPTTRPKRLLAILVLALVVVIPVLLFFAAPLALLAHDVLEGLPEGNAHWQFQNTLVNSVVDAFSESWLNVSAAHFLQDILLARDVVIAVRSTGFTRSCFSRRL